jgi:hypothetical protein
MDDTHSVNQGIVDTLIRTTVVRPTALEGHGFGGNFLGGEHNAVQRQPPCLVFRDVEPDFTVGMDIDASNVPILIDAEDQLLISTAIGREGGDMAPTACVAVPQKAIDHTQAVGFDHCSGFVCTSIVGPPLGQPRESIRNALPRVRHFIV